MAPRLTAGATSDANAYSE